MATKRMLQVGEQVRAAVATMLVNGDIADPRLKFVTINSVNMTPDLQEAKVYYSVYGNDIEKQAAKKALQKASGRMRCLLAEWLTLRCVPHLIFFYDEAIEKGNRVLEVMQSVISESKSSSVG